ncbi:MAG: hypothetical protein R2865_11580 [Deinococcales bacterium]
MGYAVANASLKPVCTYGAPSKLDPNNLSPLPYMRPDDEIGKLHTVLDALIERLKRLWII